jgi:UDP-N-acetylmuramyl pentapeptide phosphotransferase/UDP-N-acetylglucosamine-1-phosphate transferase
MATLWFVNLVNLMDGIDGMTVAEVATMTGALAMCRKRSALLWSFSRAKKAHS